MVSISAKSQDNQIILKVAHLVDPADGTVTHDQYIIIEGDQITDVVSQNDYAPADSIQIVDAGSRYIMPGMIECHTHICLALPPSSFGGDIRTYWNSFLSYTANNSTAYRSIVGAQTANELLLAGFTSIRDLGNAGNYADVAVRRSIEEGLIAGPTVVNAGKIISPSGGQYIAQMRPDLAKWFKNDVGDHVGILHPGNVKLGEVDYIFADTPDELIKAVRENVLYGANVIKIVVDDQKLIYSEADIRLIVNEAKKGGIRVAAHCITNQGAINAIKAGVHSIEHGSGMTKETLMLAKSHNIHIVPIGGPLKEAYEIGLGIGFGTDNIRASTDKMSRSNAILRYIDYYLRSNIPNTDLVKILTINGAEILGIESHRGQIKKGYYADLIGTSENPLDNPKTLKKVSFVMKNGVVVKEN